MAVSFQLNCNGAVTDFTKEVIIDKLKLTKELNAENEQQRDLSASILATAEAYTYLKTHLIDSNDRYSNYVCVTITLEDYDCNKSFNFRTNSENLKWCDDDECVMQFDLQSEDEQLDCIDNTLIADNIQPLGHPEFRYCDVTRPLSILVFLIAIALIIDNTIILIINAIIAFINLLPGANFTQITPLAQALAGCERKHPSPFISTYTDASCATCGLTSDATTNPIFYDNGSAYKNLALLTAFSVKGNKFNQFNSATPFIEENKPSWTLRKFYRELSKVFNGRWYIRNNNFYFERKDRLSALMYGTTPSIDLTANDKENLQGSVCFSFNGERKISQLFMTYAADSTDKEGDRALSRFNGEAKDFSSANYKNFEKREMVEFGAQIYTYDGIDTVYDVTVRDYTLLNGFVDYAGKLKMSSDIARLGKLIIWDGVSPLIDAEAFGRAYPLYDLSEWPNDDAAFGTIATLLLQVKNSPMFFSPLQNVNNPNLWEFHKIDMPSPDKKDNIKFTSKHNLCCDYWDLDLYMRMQINANDIGEIHKIVWDLAPKTRSVTLEGPLIN